MSEVAAAVASFRSVQERVAELVAPDVAVRAQHQFRLPANTDLSGATLSANACVELALNVGTWAVAEAGYLSGTEITSAAVALSAFATMPAFRDEVSAAELAETCTKAVHVYLYGDAPWQARPDIFHVAYETGGEVGRVLPAPEATTEYWLELLADAPAQAAQPTNPRSVDAVATYFAHQAWSRLYETLAFAAELQDRLHTRTMYGFACTPHAALYVEQQFASAAGNAFKTWTTPSGYMPAVLPAAPWMTLDRLTAAAQDALAAINLDTAAADESDEVSEEDSETSDVQYLPSPSSFARRWGSAAVGAAGFPQSPTFRVAPTLRAV